MQDDADSHAAPDSRQLIRDLAPYREPDGARSLFELAVTAVPFVLLWAFTSANSGRRTLMLKNIGRRWKDMLSHFQLSR